MQRVCLLALAMGGLVTGGCARHAATAGLPPPAASRAQPVAATGPRLLFLSGRLTAVAGAPARLEVLHLQAVAGELKQNPPEPTGPDALQLTQLDAGGHELARQQLPHPLRPVVEHVGEDHRTFTRSQAQVPTAEFFARLALQPGAATLRVTEVLGSQQATITDLSLTSLKP